MKIIRIIFFSVLMCFVVTSAWANDGIIKYTVKKGDCLSKIALRYHQPADLIAAINDFDPESPILPGYEILIPVEPGRRITVEKGDNPWLIAKRFGISTPKLLAFNDISDPKSLKPGDILAIPAATEEDEIIAYNESQIAKKPRMKLSYREEETFQWPIKGPISSGYGSRWGSEFHHGVDIVADYGTVIRAAAGGKVVFAGYKNDIYGYAIMVETGPYTLLYGHLSKIFVNEGEEVAEGDAIGRVGDSGRTTGPHLHFEVRTAEGTLNPLRFLP